MADRYRVVSSDNAQKGKFPEADWRHDDWKWMLYEFDGDTPVRLVGEDGGEPEDQLLVRDWKWVPEEMNKLAVELAARDARIRELEEALRPFAMHGVRWINAWPADGVARSHVERARTLLTRPKGGES